MNLSSAIWLIFVSNTVAAMAGWCIAMARHPLGDSTLATEIEQMRSQLKEKRAKLAAIKRALEE